MTKQHPVRRGARRGFWARCGGLVVTAGLGLSSLGAAPPPELPVEKHTLDNGLTLLLSQDRSLPVVAVEVRYLVGSGHERQGKSGFAHLFEHLMFQGSEHFDNEYFAPFEPIGGSVNGTTNTDRTNYFERVPSEYLELALWMESDRMFNLLPVLTQAKLDNQRDVVKNERRQSYENQPYGMVWLYLAKAMYPVGHPYHHTTIGSHQDLTNASLEDVKDFFRTYYVPSNAVVTVVGDFEPAATKQLVEKYFGGHEPGQRAAQPQAPEAKLQKVVHVQQTDDVKLPRIYLAWHSPAFMKSGDAELDLLASVLSDGKTSRLYKPLVYDKKVASDVAVFQASRDLGSNFIVQVTAAQNVPVERLATETLSALKQALATPPSKDELERAVNAWRKSFYGRVEGVLERALLLGTYYQATGDASYLDEDLARYTGATPESVHQAAKQHVDLERYVRIDITPGPKPDSLKEIELPQAAGGAK